MRYWQHVSGKRFVSPCKRFKHEQVDAVEHPTRHHRSLVFSGFTLQEAQFVLQIVIEFLFDGLKLLICVADIQDEGIALSSDNLDFSQVLHSFPENEKTCLQCGSRR